MKKGIKIFLIILISLLVLAGGIFGISSAITLSACKNIENSPITMMPSVDIVQPWMFADYDDEDYDNYLQSLKNDFHYDTIIVQMTRSENYVLEMIWVYLLDYQLKKNLGGLSLAIMMKHI